ncbi:MAG TPA: YihY/virulence factor BrkB family protein [Cytophagaceae bacterium]|nr:YihY/virulence factor BrkB family protein [Cytophagaceae bacterium]
MIRFPKVVTKSTPFKVFTSFLKEIHFTKKKVNMYVFLVILQKELIRDGIMERARAMAFSFMLSMFPAIIFTFTLIPYIPIQGLKDQVMDSLSDVLPQSMYQTVSGTIYEILNIPHGGLMSFGFVFAMYSATNGIMAMMNAFNQCYSSSDRRTFVKKLMISFLVIILLTVIVVIAIGITVLLEIYLHYLPDHQLTDTLALVIGKYVVVFLIFYIGISMIYYIAPAVHKRWSFFSHGSFIATIMILAFTMVFSYYVDHFNSYNKVYGSIGALIGLMLWFNMISLMLLIGYEINACIEVAEKDYYRKTLLKH